MQSFSRQRDVPTVQLIFWASPILFLLSTQGHVLSDGEPIQDVGFLLFSKTVTQRVCSQNILDSKGLKNVQVTVYSNMIICILRMRKVLSVSSLPLVGSTSQPLAFAIKK